MSASFILAIPFADLLSAVRRRIAVARSRRSVEREILHLPGNLREDLGWPLERDMQDVEKQFSPK